MPKGRRDRDALLSPHLLATLRNWWKVARSPVWLTYSRSRVAYRQANGQTTVVADSLGGPRVSGSVQLQYAGERFGVGLGLNHSRRQILAVPAMTGADREGQEALTSVQMLLTYKPPEETTFSLIIANITKPNIRQFVDISEILNYLHITGFEMRIGIRFSLDGL